MSKTLFQVEFAPDVCSRVTLEMQCLNQVLRSERPDVDEKRNDLLKLQGEFAVRLRQLEKVVIIFLLCRSVHLFVTMKQFQKFFGKQLRKTILMKFSGPACCTE